MASPNKPTTSYRKFDKAFKMQALRMLNLANSDFQRVRLLQTEPFLYDPGIKQA